MKNIADLSLIFTFHNVSINTQGDPGRNGGVNKFTFHNVSINTERKGDGCGGGSAFTFHNVSINTTHTHLTGKENKNLHSTMFLLIQLGADFDAWVLNEFTFHNVSINTCCLL